MEKEPAMKALAVVLLAGTVISACGTSTTDRAESGAAIGAGVGLLAGPPGVVVGALAGGATGAVTNPSQINLGEPVWKMPLSDPAWNHDPVWNR
jgi:hypothetical protein